MGLPLEKIIVAVNQNDILYRFFEENNYSKGSVIETISPSMDISIASNFERLIYDFYSNRDAKVCNDLFNNFPTSSIQLNEDVWSKSNEIFTSVRINDQDTLAAMSETFNAYHYTIDPHTAVGFQAAQLLKDVLDSAIVILSTAHPAKFPETLKSAGLNINNIPNSLSSVMDKEEYLFNCEADQSTIIDYIKQKNL